MISYWTLILLFPQRGLIHTRSQVTIKSSGPIYIYLSLISIYSPFKCSYDRWLSWDYYIIVMNSNELQLTGVLVSDSSATARDLKCKQPYMCLAAPPQQLCLQSAKCTQGSHQPAKGPQELAENWKHPHAPSSRCDTAQEVVFYSAGMAYFCQQKESSATMEKVWDALKFCSEEIEP